MGVVDASLLERENKIYYSFENTKSKHVACKYCGSRLATAHIRSNFCPLCRADLRPASARNAIATSEKMIKDIDEKIKTMERKQTKKSKIKWLVKIEYHT